MICVILFTDSVSIPDVKNVNVNMSLGLTLTWMPAVGDFMVCYVCACVCVYVGNQDIFKTSFFSPVYFISYFKEHPLFCM